MQGGCIVRDVGSGAQLCTVSIAPSQRGATTAAPKRAAAGHALRCGKGRATRVHVVFGRLQARQQALMAAAGTRASDWALMAPSDIGVAAVHRWLRDAGYAAMWDARLPAQQGAAPASANADDGRVLARVAAAPPSPEAVLDKWQRHTRHCKTCQKVGEGVERRGRGSHRRLLRWIPFHWRPTKGQLAFCTGQRSPLRQARCHPQGHERTHG